MKKQASQRKRVVLVSGGFDPVHVGHARLFNAAKKLGDELLVVLNNDNWLMKKKGFTFMDEKERKEIIESFRSVDRVALTSHGKNDSDRSVCREILKYRPDVFANGGDRFLDNIPEVAACKEIGCEMVFNVGEGGKVQSSSELARRVIEFGQRSREVAEKLKK